MTQQHQDTINQYRQMTLEKMQVFIGNVLIKSGQQFDQMVTHKLDYDDIQSLQDIAANLYTLEQFLLQQEQMEPPRL